MNVLKISEADGFWFITSIEAPKVKEIEKNFAVNLTFQSRDKYLSVAGNGNISTDHTMIKQLWSEHLKPWFPAGPESPDIALIQVIPTSSEYWEFGSIGKKLRFAFETGKAFIQHKKVDSEAMGTHDKISFEQTVRR